MTTEPINDEVVGLRLVADHVHRVQGHLNAAVGILLARLIAHDRSKYSAEESALITGKAYLDSLAYNSAEYKQALANVRMAVVVHYRNNRHHPEHYEAGVWGMSLFDLLEMICDWKAASEASKDGSIDKSIAANIERFHLPEALVAILRNTVEEMGWGEGHGNTPAAMKGTS